MKVIITIITNVCSFIEIFGLIELHSSYVMFVAAEMKEKFLQRLDIQLQVYL